MADQVLDHLQKTYPEFNMNFDLEDADRKLRVESRGQEINIARIIGLLNNPGFTADILPDVPLAIRLK